MAKRLLLALADAQLCRQLAVKVFAPAGYGVIQALTGAEVRKAADGKRIDLIFMGDHLSDEDPFELAEELKMTNPTLPVVMLAKRATRENLVRSMQLGFVDYLTLPLDKDAALFAARRGVERKRRWDSFLKKETGRITGPLNRRLSEMESILEEVNDGVVVLDPQNRVVMVNQVMRQAFSLGEEELIGRQARDLFTNQDLLRILEDPNAQAEHLEIESLNARAYDLHASRIPGVGTVASLHDISYLKQLDHLRRDFVNTVSHDLRSPLTAILGYAELIERAGPVNPQQAQFIQRVKSSVHATTALIDDLLNLGRVEVGLMDQKPVDMKLVVAQAIEGLQTQIQEKDQTLRMSETGTIPEVRGNSTQLGQLVSNLIGNAIKYTPKGGEISVKLREEQNQLILHVADNGPGIPIEDQNHIFEKFYRASNAALDVQGTGLGLAIVKTIVENHRGRIWVDSKLGEGSVFTVVLPIAKDGTKPSA